MSEVEAPALEQMKIIFNNKVAELQIKVNSFLIPSREDYEILISEV